MAIALHLVVTKETPNSVLRDRTDTTGLVHTNRFYIGDQPRLSTCSDVAWTRDNMVVTCNLTGQALHVYEYLASSSQAIHRQTIPSQYRLGGVTVSPDGRSLAVTHSNPGHRVAVHRVASDGTVMAIADKASPVLGGSFVHAVQYSPDGRYLFVTQFETQSNIVVLDAESLEVITGYPTPYEGPDKRFAKSVCFTSDGRFAFVAYSSVASSVAATTSAVITVHGYSPETGRLSGPLALLGEGLFNIECLELLDDGILFAVDQYTNCVLEIAFDERTRQLSIASTVLGPADDLGSPHGIARSGTGMVALTDHEQDLVRIYRSPRGAEESLPSREATARS